MAITSFSGEHFFLSNFYNCNAGNGIRLAGYWWSTVEHYYQAAKCTDIKQARAIMTTENPAFAKKLGRKATIRPDWDQVKDNIMLYAVRAKFRNHYLAQKLLDTGNEELVEGNTWGDTYWGVCGGVGENKLGKILMQVREELRLEYDLFNLLDISEVHV